MSNDSGGMLGQMTDPYGKNFGRPPTLTDFLLARIAHDHRVYSGHQHGLRPELAAHLLAECEAKRRIVGLFARGEQYGVVLRLIALPYADHPDYREEWKP